jgi:hypothetical protein
MERYSAATDGFSSLCAGISRAVRLSHFADDDRNKTIISVAVGVAAPVLIGYVYWILEEALKLGLQTLYFVSRDGEILLAIARQVAVTFREFSKIELRYLYGSRQAWYFPAIKTKKDLEETCNDWLFNDTYTVKDIFLKMNIEIDEIKDMLQEKGLSNLLLKTSLSWVDKNKLKKFLLDSTVLSFILLKASQYRYNALSYFRQEGLAERKLWGLVDLGWRGKQLRSLALLVKEISDCLPIGFYFSTVKFKGVEYRSFIPPKDFIKPYALMGEITPLLELFCSGSHGSLLNYKKNASGIIYPHLNEIKYDNSSVLDLYRNSVMDFFCYCPKEIFTKIKWNFDRNMLLALLGAFWYAPTRQEIEVWGECLLSHDLREKIISPIARKLRFKDAMLLCCPFRIKVFFINNLQYRIYWLFGSLLKTPLITRYMIFFIEIFCTSIKRLLRREM